MGTVPEKQLNKQGLTSKRGMNNPSCAISKRLYSIQEGAVYLGRSVWAVREMLWAGKMPYVKDGKRILLDILDMDAWIERSKTRTIY